MYLVILDFVPNSKKYIFISGLHLADVGDIKRIPVLFFRTRFFLFYWYIPDFMYEAFLYQDYAVHTKLHDMKNGVQKTQKNSKGSCSIIKWIR